MALTAADLKPATTEYFALVESAEPNPEKGYTKVRMNSANLGGQTFFLRDQGMATAALANVGNVVGVVAELRPISYKDGGYTRYALEANPTKLVPPKPLAKS